MKKFIENAKETMSKAKEAVSAKFPYSDKWVKTLTVGTLATTFATIPTYTNAAGNTGKEIANSIVNFVNDCTGALLIIVPALTVLLVILHLLAGLNGDEHALAQMKRRIVVTLLVGMFCFFATAGVGWYYGYFN